MRAALALTVAVLLVYSLWSACAPPSTLPARQAAVDALIEANPVTVPCVVDGVSMTCEVLP